MLSALVRNSRLSWSAAVAVVFAITAFAFTTGRRYLEASYWATHSAALRGSLESTLAAMTEAETAERGYLLTGDESFLAPYFDARPALRTRLVALRTLTAGDAAQGARLVAIERLVDEGLETIDAGVLGGRGPGGGVDLARLDRGRDQVARLREQVGEMAADEQRRLDAHEREAERARTQTERALFAGSLLTVGIALTAFLRVRRDSRRLAEASDSLAFSEARLRRLTEAAFEGILVSEDDRVADANAALALMFGYEPAELAGLDLLALIAPDDRGRVRAYLASCGEGVYECRGLRKGGEPFPIEVRNRPLPWGDRSLRVTAMRDITERKRTETELLRHAERLRALSLGDELTGLSNRRGFLELARQHLAQADRSGRPASLFFIDLNGMKPINDRLGHEAGDRLLADAAQILRSTFRGSDVLARLGGDEFVALAPDAGPAEIGALEARLRAALVAFNASSERPYRVSMSIGASLYDPRRPRPVEGLLAEADAKMYARKQARKGSPTSSMLPARASAPPPSSLSSRPPIAALVPSVLAALPPLLPLAFSPAAPPESDDETPPEVWPPTSRVMKSASRAAAADPPSSDRVTIARIALGPSSRRNSSGRALPLSTLLRPRHSSGARRERRGGPPLPQAGAESRGVKRESPATLAGAGLGGRPLTRRRGAQHPHVRGCDAQDGLTSPRPSRGR